MSPLQEGAMDPQDIFITIGNERLASIPDGGDDADAPDDPNAFASGAHWVHQCSELVQEWFMHRNTLTLEGALAFVPWILQDAFFQAGTLPMDKVVVARPRGALLQSDAGGFNKLTGSLKHHENGAELLSHSLQGFYTPLIDLITAYRGDVIKFGGDSLTVFFPAVDDTQSAQASKAAPPHGTYGLPDMGPMATAVLRAAACSIEIHKKLSNYDTGAGNQPGEVTLSLHIGISCGDVTFLQVGGVAPPETTNVPRFEYVLGGLALEQLHIAKDLSRLGETVITQDAWRCIRQCVIEGAPIEGMPAFHRLMRLDESKYTYPTVKRTALVLDCRGDRQFGISELHIIRRYLPLHVFKRIECGTLTYVNEMRKVTIVFVSISGTNVSNDKGCHAVQDCVTNLQRALYAHEGTLNKLLFDEGGTLVLLAVFGLPPLVHVDDPTRAVLACFDMARCLQNMNMEGRFGIATGRSYCGVCGSASRMEYTVLGDHVNLASNLMELRRPGPGMSIICDASTKDGVSSEIVMNELAPVRLKKRTEAVSVYTPDRKELSPRVGLSCFGKIFFPWHNYPYGGCSSDSFGTAELLENLRQLGSVKAWEGMKQASEILGGPFSVDLHDDNRVIRWESPTTKAPEGSPFNKGGVIILEGPTGSGKSEVSEHMILYAAVHYQVLPIFGSMGPRTGDGMRLACELIRSTLNIYRHMDQDAVPRGDVAALRHLLPDVLEKHGRVLSAILNSDGAKGLKNHDMGSTLSVALDVVVSLVAGIVSHTPVLICLQFEHGTSIYPQTVKSDMDIFQRAVAELHKLTDEKKLTENVYPVTLLVVTRNMTMHRDNPAVQEAERCNTLLSLHGLTDEGTVEYMSYYLGVGEQLVPVKLREFVLQVTGGIPLFIRETLNRLQESEHLIKHLGQDNRTIKGLECKDMDRVDIASWESSSMVGMTVCKIESLDPLPSAVLKMSTCFQGAFTLADIAASACSPWADASNLDNMCLFHALRHLVRSEFIEKVETPSPSSGGHRTQHFQNRNLLIRAVGSSRVLEAQRNSVKRQALMDRALTRRLPRLMEALEAKRNEVHVPWYYQQAWLRMGFDWQPPSHTRTSSSHSAAVFGSPAG